MKKAIFQMLAVVASAVLIWGCETSSTNEVEVKITPENATVSKAAPSVELSASGGWQYNWSLSDTKIGKLSRHYGSSVIYTGTTFGTNLEQAVTVSISNYTNANATVSASATIRHK